MCALRSLFTYKEDQCRNMEINGSGCLWLVMTVISPNFDLLISLTHNDKVVIVSADISTRDTLISIPVWVLYVCIISVLTTFPWYFICQCVWRYLRTQMTTVFGDCKLCSAKWMIEFLRWPLSSKHQVSRVRSAHTFVHHCPKTETHVKHKKINKCPERNWPFPLNLFKWRWAFFWYFLWNTCGWIQRPSSAIAVVCLTAHLIAFPTGSIRSKRP